MGSKRSSRSQACYRLMLLAGMDPLIKVQKDWSTSALSYVVMLGTSVSPATPFYSNNIQNLSGRTSVDASSCRRSH